MAVAISVIDELEEAIALGSSERRVETLRRVTDMFLGRAPDFTEQQIALFDDVIGRLADGIEAAARSRLAERLAPVANAPIDVIRTLAHDDDIAVAGPVLAKSARLSESDLVAIATTKGQQHLHMISGRAEVGEAVTDVLLTRGSSEVVRTLARNDGARFSKAGFSTLVERARDDDLLAESVGLRADLPPHHLRQLIARATELVQRRLCVRAGPQRRQEIETVLSTASRAVEAQLAPQRSYEEAERRIAALHAAGALNEQALHELATTGRFEDSVAALAKLCAVPVDVVDRLMSDDDLDAILIPAKAAGFEWTTVQAVIRLKNGGQALAADDLNKTLRQFRKLSEATAQRVVRFWLVRQVASKSA
jgi:uncharacterized protein (DUF2336 family)